MTLTMIGRISECILLAYRTPADSVRGLVPAPLELVRRDGDAFWNIVACRIEAMRPHYCPRVLGFTYHHVGYRLYVRARGASGEQIDGLHFVRSDADRWPVVWGGNLKSDFRFHRSRIERSVSTGSILLRVETRDGADASLRARPAQEWRTSRESLELLKYRPIALSVDRSQRWLKLAEVVCDESAWRESPIDVLEARWQFLERLGQSDLHLASATRVAPVDYQWKLGRCVRHAERSEA